MQILRHYRSYSVRVTYSGIGFLGFVFVIVWLILLHNQAQELQTRPLLSLDVKGVDIQKWDFQAGFVREDQIMKSKLPKDDVNGTRPHVRALSYLIEEPDLCRNHHDLFIISYVHSAVKKRENRQLIRDTWGDLKYYPQVRMRVIFVFGASVSEEEQKLIKEESDKYHDIIQLDFVDSYKNLSYKGVAALQWISEHCLNADWILKSDDDMVINVFALTNYLKEYASWKIKKDGERPNQIMCAVWWGMPVLRGNGCAKWCVTEEEWPDKSFPTYCSGSAFIIPTHTAPAIYHAYFHARFLWVDDAYISGVLPKEAGIKHHPIHSLYELNFHLLERNMLQGNRLFCHYPGKAEPRSEWWHLIAKKEGYD